MIEGIERFYQQIADSIQDAIPEEWDAAKMEAIFFPGSSTYFGEYVRKADGKARDFPTSPAAESAFREIRRGFKKAGKKAWGQATFELYPDGRFNMAWGYENCNENGDTRFDEKEEMRRHEARRKRLTE